MSEAPNVVRQVTTNITSPNKARQVTQENEELEQDCKIIQNPNKQAVAWDDDVNKTMRANFTTMETSIVEHHRRIHKGTFIFTFLILL